METEEPVYEWTEERLKALDETFFPDLSYFPCPVCGKTPIYKEGYCKERWNNPKMSCLSPVSHIGITCVTDDCAMSMTYSIRDWLRYSQMKKYRDSVSSPGELAKA